MQERTGAERAAVRLKAMVPADFHARFRFTITGGEMWKSVGLCSTWPTAVTRRILVYLSAYAGGPKRKIAFKQGADYVYPAEGAQARPSSSASRRKWSCGCAGR